MASKLSLIVPSRNERFLSPTIRDVLSKATGDIEVLVVLDGGVLVEPLPDDPRVRVLSEVPVVGMRDCVNHAVAVATGEYIFKLDGHCSVAEGFDEVLTADCDDDWIVVPRRYRLDPEAWAFKATEKPPIDAHSLSYPFERPDDPTCGLHGGNWPARAVARTHVLLDEELSTQGSAWLMKRRYWETVGPLSREHYGPNINEAQEYGLKCQLSGGRLMVNKKTWYAHLAKGSRYRRGYVVSKREHRKCHDYCVWFWLTDQPFRGRTRTLRSLIEQFWSPELPVPSWPCTPDGRLDWDEVARATATFMTQYTP